MPYYINIGTLLWRKDLFNKEAPRIVCKCNKSFANFGMTLASLIRNIITPKH